MSGDETTRATALILALIKRAHDEPDDDETEPRKITDEERAKFIKIIRNLLRVAFNPGVTPGEREAFMQKAAKLAGQYCIGWNEVGEDPKPGWRVPAGAQPPGAGEDGELLPDPGHPLAVARLLVSEWMDADGNLTLRHWNDVWMEHAGSHWREQEDGAIRGWFYRRTEHALYINQKCELMPWSPTKGKVNAVLDALSSAIALVGSDTVMPAWLDDHGQVLADPPASPRRIVAVENGLLDTGSNKLLDPSAAFFNEIAVPFAYHPDAPEPARWARFLTELWPDDPAAVDLLKEWFGYVISGRTDLHKIGGLFGPPRSGKGTIARVLAALVGPASVAGPTMAQLGMNFGMWPLVGKTLAIISDARLSKSDARMAVERLLAISGEDRITIDHKYHQQWTGTLSARFMILSNEPPAFQDASGAIVSRFVIMTTHQSFLGKEDPDLTARLLTELTGILNWSLAGLKRLDANGGKFSEPVTSAEVIKGMQELAKPVSVFVEERCKLSGTVSKTDLYDVWRDWCKETGNHAGSIQEFSRDLNTALPGKLKPFRPRAPEGEKRPYKWRGVSLLLLLVRGPDGLEDRQLSFGLVTARR